MAAEQLLERQRARERVERASTTATGSAADAASTSDRDRGTGLCKAGAARMPVAAVEAPHHTPAMRHPVSRPLLSVRSRRRSLLALAAFVLLLPGGVGACRRAGSQAPAAAERTTVRVENNSLRDQVIYVVRSSVRQRIGEATSHATTTLVIPPSFVGPGTPLRFIADPIGGGPATTGEETIVNPGDEVVIVIQGT